MAVQLLSVKQVSRATQEAVEATQNHIMALLSVSDVARAIELIPQVQTLVESHQYSHARLLLQQLDNELIALNNDPNAAQGATSEEYQALLEANRVHLANLSDVISTPEKRLSPLELNQNLEKVRGVLVRFQGHLKRKGS